MTNPHCGQDSAAYVLGALDDAELDPFRSHLRTCTVCQAEIEAFGGVLDTLALSAPQYRAPRDLRRRVVRSVREDARRRRARTPARSRSLTVPTFRPGWTTGAAMAVMLVAVVVVGLTLGRGHDRFTTAFPKLSPGSPSSGETTRVFSAQQGDAQVMVNGSHGELVVRRLTPLNDSHVYEVWLLRGHDTDAQPTNALFQVSAGGTAAVSIPGNMRSVTEVMVTAEPAGGTAVPTTPTVIAARVA